ncbi:hypothetical protein GCK32_021688, partial [Trichostrongylus colubriformis]
LTTNASANGTIFQLPQGCVYTNSSNGSEGEATANSLLTSSTKGDKTGSQNPLLSFPFQFNIQQACSSIPVILITVVQSLKLSQAFYALDNQSTATEKRG